MITRLFASALLLTGLSQAALAQGNNQQNQPSTSAENMQAPPQGATQSLRQRLMSAGYRDVNIVPSSLVITAIDKGGRPVLMRITPNSMFFLVPAISSSGMGATRQLSNASAQQSQSSTSAETTQASPQDVPQSVTTGAARDSNESAEQNQPSVSADDAQISADNAQSSRDVPQSLRDRLTSSGFSDVNIVPRSFVITARDQSDRPVMMRITPRSIFFVTEIPATSSSTTGAANPSESEQSR